MIPPNRTDDATRPPDESLRVICACGHNAQYDALTEFKSDGGELVYNNHQDLYAARCASCDEGRPVKAGMFDWDDIGREFCLTLGAFEKGHNPLHDSLNEEYDPTRTDFSSVANPVYIARQRFDPICIKCGERITEDNRREDGNAPEVGWAYYECSSCGNTMHPESLGSLGGGE